MRRNQFKKLQAFLQMLYLYRTWAQDIRNKFNNWIDNSFIISKTPFSPSTNSERSVDWKPALKKILTSDNNSKKFYLTNPNNTPRQYMFNSK